MKSISTFVIALVVVAACLCVPSYAQTQDHTVTLTWNPPATLPTGMLGYNVYQSPTSGTGYVKLNTTPVSPANFTTVPLSGGNVGGAGKDYFFVVTTVRAACTTCSPAETSPVESAFSNEAKAHIPAPLPAPPPVPDPPTGVTTTVNP